MIAVCGIIVFFFFHSRFFFWPPFDVAQESDLRDWFPISDAQRRQASDRTVLYCRHQLRHRGCTWTSLSQGSLCTPPPIIKPLIVCSHRSWCFCPCLCPPLNGGLQQLSFPGHHHTQLSTISPFLCTILQHCTTTPQERSSHLF